MGYIMHKDQNRLKVKQIDWQDIGRNKQGKNMVSLGKKCIKRRARFCKIKILSKFDFAACPQAITPYVKYGTTRDR